MIGEGKGGERIGLKSYEIKNTRANRARPVTELTSRSRRWRRGRNCIRVCILSSILSNVASLSQCFGGLALNRRGRVDITRDEGGVAAGGIRPSHALADGPRSSAVICHLNGVLSGRRGA